MIVVSDSSPLLSFGILGMLDILNKIFEGVIVPTVVHEELSVSRKPFAEEMKLFLKGKVVAVDNRIAVELLEKEVDPGEAEAIVLAMEKKISDILIDDFKGRRAAKANGLNPIGTIGVLLQAKKVGYISQIKPLLDKLIKNKARIGYALYQKALELAKEI
jgi:uncharacterized protein